MCSRENCRTVFHLGSKESIYPFAEVCFYTTNVLPLNPKKIRFWLKCEHLFSLWCYVEKKKIIATFGLLWIWSLLGFWRRKMSPLQFLLLNSVVRFTYCILPQYHLLRMFTKSTVLHDYVFLAFVLNYSFERTAKSSINFSSLCAWETSSLPDERTPGGWVNKYFIACSKVQITEKIVS